MLGLQDPEYYMEIALEEARLAASRDEIPVGAVLVDAAGEVLARDGNRSIELADPTAHAEIMVLRAAGKKVGNYRLLNSTMYVTLEPCVMCAGALVHARVQRLVIATPDPLTGAVSSIYSICTDERFNHVLEVEIGLLAEVSSQLLRTFFRRRRSEKKNNGIQLERMPA